MNVEGAIPGREHDGDRLPEIRRQVYPHDGPFLPDNILAGMPGRYFCFGIDKVIAAKRINNIAGAVGHLDREIRLFIRIVRLVLKHDRIFVYEQVVLFGYVHRIP